ncbi:hypothetical protein R1flu_016809 [Riccia fluitans]|uniref:WD repeat-containing protein 13 n=1 Tax=Riccia fluitans TaxID=41844 RepID=A0ABD1YNF6_9MARC
MLDNEELHPLEEHRAEFYACILEPGNGSSQQDAAYVGQRRLLLYKKALAGKLKRQTWKGNGRGYVDYREYIRQYKQWDNSRPTSPLSYPGDSGRWSSSPYLNDRSSENNSKGRASNSSFVGPRTSFGSAGESETLNFHHEPGYSFVGMHCIFDDIKASVNVLRFGHLSSELLAFGAADGSLVICSVAQPPRILHHLMGHTKEITDFDWSLNNQCLSSSSLDKSVRVWSVEKGNCLRVIYGNVAQLCIRFHPLNNNFLFVGHADQGLTVINFSTGRVLHRLSVESNITAMDMDHTGHVLFAGDAQGCIHSIKVDMHTGAMTHGHRTTKGMHRKSLTTTVQFRTFSLLAGGPVLLAASQDGSIRFFSVAMEVDGYLSLKCCLKLAPRARNIRASFCPLLSLERGEFIVSGNEDTNVYFYDFTRPKRPCVNKLQGHSVPTVGVAWNYGENLLATSDCEGVVIVWKRARDNAK